MLWVTSDPHEDSYTIDEHLRRAGIEFDYCPWVEKVDERLSNTDYNLILINGDGLTPSSNGEDPFKVIFDKANKGDRFNYTGRPAVSLELVKRVHENFPELTILTYGIDEITISTEKLKKTGSKEHLIVEGNCSELADKIAAYARGEQ